MPIEAEWKKVKDNPPFADWEVYPKSPWNYALQIDREHPEQSIDLRGSTPVGDVPVLDGRGARWSPRSRAAACPPGAWRRSRRSAADEPRQQATEPLEDLTLIPYGCTDLRITEFPTLATPKGP